MLEVWASAYSQRTGAIVCQCAAPHVVTAQRRLWPGFPPSQGQRLPDSPTLRSCTAPIARAGEQAPEISRSASDTTVHPPSDCISVNRGHELHRKHFLVHVPAVCHRRSRGTGAIQSGGNAVYNRAWHATSLSVTEFWKAHPKPRARRSTSHTCTTTTHETHIYNRECPFQNESRGKLRMMIR